MRPVGYDCGLVSVYASENQPEAALEEARRVMERILTDTELEQTQPGSGSPYLISDERVGPTPVRQTARDGSTRIVGWEWLVYVAPSLASAQACEEVLAIRTRRTEP